MSRSANATSEWKLKCANISDTSRSWFATTTRRSPTTRTHSAFSSSRIPPLGGEKRWVLLAPPGSNETRLLIAKASTPEQMSRVGNQTGGRVFLFLHTDDFWRDYRAMSSRGVKFCETPRDESYGTVAVFEDLYGNRWDLLQLRK